MKMGKKVYDCRMVCEMFERNNCIFLDENYVNTRTKMSYEDKDGYRYEISINSILTNGEDSINRQLIVSSYNKWSVYNMNIYVKLNGDTCKLLSKEYINQSHQLDWVCKKGHTFHTSWGNFYHKGYRCKTCATEDRMYAFEDCKEDVSKRQGYNLLAIDRRKNNANNLELYYHIKHTCGNQYWVLKQQFDKGKSCRPCIMKDTAIKRRQSEDEIRNLVEGVTSGKYSYLKTEYKNLKDGKKARFIKVKHNDCGTEYWVRHSNWLSGRRCPNCISTDAQKVPYSKWKKRVEVISTHKCELLSVYYKTRKDTDRNEAWLKIKCTNCGEILHKVGGSWRKGCPNCLNSKGEEEVKSVLAKYNVSFIPQYKYKDLKGVGGRRLSYDFYIPTTNLLIEYQGEFHDGTDRIIDKSYFPTQQEHDKRKREYAEQHGIDLLEIWYYDFDNIESILKGKLNL